MLVIQRILLGVGASLAALYALGALVMLLPPEGGGPDRADTAAALIFLIMGVVVLLPALGLHLVRPRRQQTAAPRAKTH